MTNLHIVLKSRGHFTNKSPYAQGHTLPSGHIQLWENWTKEGRMPKILCLCDCDAGRLRAPLERRSNQNNNKGNQP